MILHLKNVILQFQNESLQRHKIILHGHNVNLH